MRKKIWYYYHVCQLSMPQKSYKDDKYKWMGVDTIYDLISNVHLCHIQHIRNGDIFLNQYKIITKRISAINTASV